MLNTRLHRFHGPKYWAVAAMGALLTLAPAASSQESMEEYLEGLRVRRLDGLAEAFTQQVLRDSTAPLDRQVTATIQHSVLLVTQAGEVQNPQAAEKLWNKAAAVIESLLSTTQDESAVMQLRFQLALVLYTRGDWLNRLRELSEESHPNADKAQFYLSSSISILQELAEQIARPAPRKPGARRLDLGETQVFASVLRHRIGAAYLALSETYAADDAKRQQALQSAISTLESIDASTSPDPIRVGLELVTALRHAQRFDAALGAVERFKPLAVQQPDKDELLAEQVETLLAQQKTLDALAVLFPALQSREEPPSRWNYLYLKVLLIQADAMRGEPEKASKLQASALMQLHRLEQQHASLWVRRAELQLSRHASTLVGEEVEELQRAAEILKRAGKHSEAAQVYQKAADHCLEKQQRTEAYPLLFEAGRSWERAGRSAEAAGAFDQLVSLFPDNEAAAATSLRVILNRRQDYASQKGETQRSSLQQAIERHLAKYGADETAGEAYYILGMLDNDLKQYPSAIASLQKVPPTHRSHAVALLQISRIYQQWLRPMQFDSEDSLEEALRFHDGLLTGSAPLSPDQRLEVAVRHGQFLLDPRSANPAQAEKVLRAAIAGSTPSARQAAGWRLLVMSLIEQNRFNDAEVEIAANQDQPPEKLLELVRLLNGNALYFDETARRGVGFVSQKALAALRRRERELPENLRPEVQFAQTQIAAFLGTEPHIREAMNQLSELRRANPKDARLLEILALCLMQDRRYEAAVSQWRTLLAGIRKESMMWYRARLNLIVCLRRAGQREEAKQILDLMRVLHPGLGGPLLKPRFEAEAERLKDVR